MLKLQKKLNNDDLYFVVLNMESEKIVDWFIFNNYKECPKLENYFFNLMFLELKETFNDLNEDYSRIKFLASLLIRYNILMDGNHICIKNSTLLNNIYMKIRFDCMNNNISSFKNKISIKAIENYKNELLKIKKDNIFTNDVFEELNKISANLKCPIETISKEITFLCLERDYHQALKKAVKFKSMVDELEIELNKIDNEKDD